MDTNRREFLKGTAWMGAAAIAAGCISAKNAPCCGAGGSMFGFAAKPLKKIRVGCVGIGSRGSGAVHRLAIIPGVEVAALCDIEQYRVDAQQKWLKANNKPAAKEFVGAEAYKALCDWDGVDCIYNTTPWELHVPVALCAMRSGKHAFIEVPSAFTLDECWELVETSEKTRLNCMQLENCCYGEAVHGARTPRADPDASHADLLERLRRKTEHRPARAKARRVLRAHASGGNRRRAHPGRSLQKISPIRIHSYSFTWLLVRYQMSPFSATKKMAIERKVPETGLEPVQQKPVGGF